MPSSFTWNLFKMQNRKPIYYILATVLSVVLLLLFAELATRGISLVSGKGFTLALHELNPRDEAVQSNYQWHPFSGVTFRPNIVIEGGHPNQVGMARVFVDEKGFLVSPGPQLSLEKAPGEIRIATIGGSTTASINLSYEENWPGIVGAYLQTRFPDRKISVINAGIPGFDTAQSIGNLALRVMPYQPDIVIIYHAYNDLKAVRAEGSFSPDYTHIHPKPFGFHVDAGWTESLLENSMLYVRARNRNLVVDKLDRLKASQETGLPTVPEQAVRTFEQHMRALAAIARSGNAQVVFPSFATLHEPGLDYGDDSVVSNLSNLRRSELRALLYYTPGLTVNGVLDGIVKYNDVMRRIAEQVGVHWVDTASALNHEEKYFLDRVHFSREGANRFAAEIAPKLEELVR